jgi:hypothetical protein
MPKLSANCAWLSPIFRRTWRTSMSSDSAGPFCPLGHAQPASLRPSRFRIGSEYQHGGGDRERSPRGRKGRILRPSRCPTQYLGMAQASRLAP